MLELLVVVAVWSLQFAIVLGVAHVSRWMLRFFLSPAAIRPQVRTMAAIWLVGLVASNAYWGYTAWYANRFGEELFALQGQIREEARQAAESQGETVPPIQPLPPDAKANPPKILPPQPGPIYNNEFYFRYHKAYAQLYQQSVMPNIESRAVEWFLLVLWIACGATVGGYCLAVLRKSSGWLSASSLAFAVALVQCVAVGMSTAILTFVEYLMLGGQIHV
jgi:hypothetical protein